MSVPISQSELGLHRIKVITLASREEVDDDEVVKKITYFRMESSVEYAMQCASGRRRQSLQKLQAKQDGKSCTC